MLNVIAEVISTAADLSDSCALTTSCARWYTEVHCTRLSTVLSMELLPKKLGYGRDTSDTLVTATTSTVPVTLFPSYVTLKEAVPEALLSAALIWFCVMEMRGLAVVKAVLGAEDTTTVLPSKNLIVTVAVL